MAKYTTTIFDYMRSELITRGYDEFIRNNRFSDEAFITSLIIDNNEIINQMKDILFNNFKFEDSELDDYFKKTFLTEFYYFEIKFQTIELFKLKLKSYLYQHKQYISFIWDNYNSLLNGKETSKNKDTDKGTTGGSNTKQERRALTTLPQDKINLDITDNVLPYANENSVGFTKDTKSDSSSSEKNSDGERNSFNVDVVYKCKELFAEIFSDLDTILFSQVF